jgi:2-keto-3-deoxy-L-rhamnonate aldolase RhmA
MSTRQSSRNVIDQHEVTQKYLDLGTEFVAVGVDTSVLMN